MFQLMKNESEPGMFSGKQQSENNDKESGLKKHPSWSDGTPGQKRTQDDLSVFQSNPLQPNPRPPPARATPQDSSSVREMMGGFTPLFKSPEMTEKNPNHPKKLENSIADRIEEYQRTITKFGWNGGATEGLIEVIEEIRVIVKAYQEEAGKADLAELEAKFNEVMKSSRLYYAGAALDMEKEPGFVRVSEKCTEINDGIKNKESHRLQSCTEIVPLFEQALKVQEDFDKTLQKHATQTGTEALLVKMKKLYRLIEKMVLKSNLGCAEIRDVVRGTIVCESTDKIVDVLTSLQNDNTVSITNVKDGHSAYKGGDWLDVKVIVCMAGDNNRHKCEIQIVHAKMMTVRKTMGGHQAYSDYRSLGELVESLKRDQGGEAELLALEEKIKGLLQNNRTEAVLRIARTCTRGVMTKMNEDSKISAQIADFDAQLPELVQQRNFQECAAIQHKINALQMQMKLKTRTNTDQAAGKGVKLAVDGEDSHDLSFLTKLYPSIPLSEYVNEGNFWHINKDYEGLQCISKDPFIFLVPNLLSVDQCRNLIIKGGNHFARSVTGGTNPAAVVSNNRTSWDVRVPYNEVPTVQAIFSKVLSAKVSQFEPLKLIRYEAGQYFKPHHDAGGDQHQHLAGRRITLFVYLNTCDAGGETHFTKCGIKIKPRAGLGVIHFPSYLSTAKPPPKEYTEGAKVQILRKKMEKGETVWHGTVTHVTEHPDGNKIKKIVRVEHDSVDWRKEYVGTDAELNGTIPLIPCMGGLRDERLRHEGMEASEEKFLASQWVFEDEGDQRKQLEYFDATPLGGQVL
jgi:prolyl 4-hydroxylase